jgi:hypothetical protein
LPVFALPPAESLRILMGPDASHTQNSIAAVSAEAARQRCGNATVPACFPWTIGALFDRPKREEPSEFCRVFGPWTAGTAHIAGGCLLPGAEVSVDVPVFPLSEEAGLAAHASRRGFRRLKLRQGSLGSAVVM